MSNKKLGSEPAFGALAIDKTINSEIETQYYVTGNDGMSKRFYAACAAMQGLMVSRNLELRTMTDVVQAAYKYADELLKYENE